MVYSGDPAVGAIVMDTQDASAALGRLAEKKERRRACDLGSLCDERGHWGLGSVFVATAS